MRAYESAAQAVKKAAFPILGQQSIDPPGRPTHPVREIKQIAQRRALIATRLRWR